MSEQDNVALLQRGFEAFNTGDAATLTEIIAADAVQHMPGKSAFSGEWKGRDQILGMYGKLAEASGGTFQAAQPDIKADGPDKVVVHYQAQATKGAALLDNPRVITFTIRDGKIVEVDDTDANVAAFDKFFA